MFLLLDDLERSPYLPGHLKIPQIFPVSGGS